MYFGFALESSDIDLRDIDLSDTNLDLLDIVNIFLSPRHLEDVLKTCFEDMS